MISERELEEFPDIPLEGDEGEPTVGGRFPVGGVLLRTPIEELHPDPPIAVSVTASVSEAVELMRERLDLPVLCQGEEITLADLPPIPPSFEEPADGMAAAVPAEPEDTP